MYGFEVSLTKEQVLTHISEEEVIEMAVGYKPEEGKFYLSPFRKDSEEGTWFERFNNTLTYIDFGDDKTHRDCIEFVADLHNVSYQGALEIVLKYVNEGVSVDTPSFFSLKPKKQVQKKQYFDYKAKPFMIEDREFWFSKYSITKEQLEADGTESIRWFKFWSNRLNEEIIIRPHDRCYMLRVNNKLKIYRPDQKGRSKWPYNTCTVNDIGGLNTAIKSDHLIITKSYKDWRVLKNLNYNTIWMQNEKTLPNNTTLKRIKSISNNITVFFDNDIAGKQGADKLIAQLGNNTQAFFLPDNCPKDASDFIEMYDYNVLNELLQQALQPSYLSQTV